MIRIKSTFLFLAGSTLTQMPVAFAEDGGADNSADQIIVTGQRLENVEGDQISRGATLGVFGDRDLYETPVSTKSFTDEFIADIGALNSNEIALRDASFTITNSAAINGSTAGRLRGFRIEPFESTVDGLATVASRRYSLEFIERVDILKGPSAVFTGLVGGVGGTINYITKKPLDEPLLRVTGIFSGRSELGGYADISQRFGANDNFGLRANLSYRDGESAIQFNDQKNSVVHLAFNARLNDATNFDLQYGSSYTRVLGGSGGFFYFDGVPIGPAPNSSKIGGPDWDDRETHDQFIRAQANIGLADGWSLFAAGSLSRTQERFVGLTAAVTGANGDSDAFVFAQEGEVDWGDGYSIDLGLRGKFATGAVGHSLTAIGSYLYSSSKFSDLAIDPAFEQPSFNIYTPRSQNGPAPALTGTGTFFPFQKSITKGFVIADEISFLDGRLLTTLGMRYTDLRIDSFNYGAPTPGGPNRSYRSDNWSPAVALLFKIRPNISVYANYLKAVEAGQIASPPAVNAGEIIPPGISRQYEAGVKADFGSFGATAAIFDIERPSLYTDPVTLRFDKFGKQRHRGIELDLFGTPVEGLRVLASYTHLDAKLLQQQDAAINGNRPVSVPENVFVLGFDADVPGLTGAALLANMRISGNQLYDVSNARSIPGFTVFDAGGRYRFDVGSTPVTARLNIVNLFDKNYYQSTDFTAQNGDPRTFRFTLSADF
jgi:iron complex outermembrane receptor protein